MSNEALSMAKLLIGCVTRGDVNGQYHWANLIMLDALANGARGPEVMTAAECRLYTEDAIAPPPIVPRCSQCGKRFEDFACGPTHALINSDSSLYSPCGTTEDAIEEARR